MNRRWVSFSALAAVALAVVPALADSFTYPAAGVKFNTPAGWSTKPASVGIVTFDRTNDAAVSLFAVDDGSVKEASKNVLRRLSGMIDQIKVTKEEATTINGMKAVIIEGDGRQKGVDIDWAVVVINTPSPTNDLMAVAIAEDAKLAAHKGEIRGVFASITPL